LPEQLRIDQTGSGRKDGVRKAVTVQSCERAPLLLGSTGPLACGALDRDARGLAGLETASGVSADDGRQLGVAEVFEGHAIDDKSLLRLLHDDLL
jgi:hypothetical protein